MLEADWPELTSPQEETVHGLKGIVTSLFENQDSSCSCQHKLYNSYLLSPCLLYILNLTTK